MAPGDESNNWLSFSLSSMEMLNSSSSANSSLLQQRTPMLLQKLAPAAFDASNSSADSHHYYSFADNFYATTAGWQNQKGAQEMYEEADGYMHHHQHPSVVRPKLEDFFADHSTTETQDSSLTHIYDHGVAYFGSGGEQHQQDLKAIAGFQTFSANSGSEVDDSAFAGQTHSPPVESASGERVAYSHCPINTSASAAAAGGATANSNNGLSLGVNVNHHDNNNNNKAIVPSTATATAAAELQSCNKVADTFGQRTSIYRGVTRHRWTGRYEAHLWDNSCRREGQARKGRQVYLGGYDKEDKAARAYDLAALKYWGPTATTNFPVANYTKELEEMKHATKQEFIASLRRKSSGFSRGASIYRGVTRHHQQGRWQARIGRVAGNKDLYLGTFATEEEAAEAYDIAAIKFRGVNAVTNFEMSRYDVEAIAKSPLPVGGTAKRLKLSLEVEEKLNSSMALQTPLSTSISFSAIPPRVPTIPYAVPFGATSAAPFYHHNLVNHHHLGGATTSDTSSTVSSMVSPMNLMTSPPEFFIWPHQSY